MPNKRPSDSDPESTSEQPAATAPAVRRISNPRPKKGQPKPGPEPTAAPDPTPEPETPAAPVLTLPESAPEPRDADSDDDDSPSFDGEWPAPETSGAQTQEGGKRKRRRRKNKGGQGGQSTPPQQAPADNAAPSESGDAPPEPSPQQRPQHPPRQPQPQRPKVDPALLAKRAWRIYLSEVSEEGVALISDQDARELTRRCFRLAEIFLEEQSRRN